MAQIINIEHEKLKESVSPAIKYGKHFIRQTQSICPECNMILPATVFERDSKVFMSKVCPDHGETEEDVTDAITPKDNPTNTPEEEKAEAERIIEERKIEAQKAEELLKKIEDENGPNVIVENEDEAHKDGQFIDFEPRLNKKLLLINSNHDFWRSINNKLQKINELAKKDDPPTSEIIELAASLKKDFEYIVTAFCNAYYDLDPESDTKKQVGDTLKDLLLVWSTTLTRIYRLQQN